METTSISSATTALQNASSGGAQNASLASTDFNSFLTLLTSQLRNQDPLNPQDATQWVAQLATFSSVEQQLKTNSLLEGIAGNLGGGGNLLQAASQWVGRDVEATADTIAFAGDPVRLIVPEGPQGISRDIVVRDRAGNEVFRQTTGSSRSEFEWRGRDNNGLLAPEGAYAARLETTDSEGDVATALLGVRARVEEARLIDGAVQLVLANGATAAPDSVRAVLAPAS